MRDVEVHQFLDSITRDEHGKMVAVHGTQAIVPLPIPDAMVERAAREQHLCDFPPMFGKAWEDLSRNDQLDYLVNARRVLTLALTPEGKANG